MEQMVKNQNRVIKKQTKDLIFYIFLLIVPVVQFILFYVCVNFNSVLLSFQKISTLEGTTTFTFDNIINTFQLMTTDKTMLTIAGTSLLSYALILLIGTPLGLFFSYYIYKKFPFSSGFRVLLFLPSIISAIVMVTIFRFFVDRAVPEFFNKYLGTYMLGLTENTETRYATVIFYNIWIGFGTSVLMYSNSMSGISPDIVESAHLDGATGLREFWHITLPLIYPMLTTFLITGVIGIFNNQINLYSFYGGGAPLDLQTFGYYIYDATKKAGTSRSEYPPLAAMGLLLTCVAVPLTLSVKYLLERFGPSED